MMKTAIYDILNTITTARKDATKTTLYQDVIGVLAKDKETLTYEDKRRTADNLRMLCEGCGIDYYALLEKVVKERWS